MIRTLAVAANAIHRGRDKKGPAVVVRCVDAWTWYVAIERTDENDARVIVCSAMERTCGRALLACGLALLVHRQRTTRINLPALASAVRKALT